MKVLLAGLPADSGIQRSHAEYLIHRSELPGTTAAVHCRTYRAGGAHRHWWRRANPSYWLRLWQK